MMKYAVDYGKMLFLLDDICDKVNELPVVREEAIDLVRAYEKELYEEWNKDYKYVESPDPFDYPLVVKSEEDKRKMEEYNRLEAAAEKAHRANPYHSFIYIDCAPEALNYASPGMPESDYWLYPELLEKAQAKDKSRRMKKLTYSQFIDRFSTCISGRRLDGSAYEKTLQTQSV